MPKIPFSAHQTVPSTLVSHIGPSGKGCHEKTNEPFVDALYYEERFGAEIKIFYPLVPENKKYGDTLKIVSDKSGRLVEYKPGIGIETEDCSDLYEKAKDADYALIVGAHHIKDPNFTDYVDRLIIENKLHVEVEFNGSDCNRNPIHPYLLGKADEIIVYPQPCAGRCGGRNLAYITQRTINGKPSDYSMDAFEVDDKTEFKPVCHVCHELPGAPWEEFLSPIKEKAIENKLIEGRMKIFTGTMRTGKTRHGLRWVSRGGKSNALYCKPSSDTREESGFSRIKISDRAPQDKFWISEEAFLFDPKDPLDFYYNENVQESRAILIDEAQLIDQRFATVLEAKRIGGGNDKTNHIAIAGIGAGIYNEIDMGRKNGEYFMNSMPFLLPDASSNEIRFVKCQHMLSEEGFDLENYKNPGNCMNRGSRHVLIRNGSVQKNFMENIPAEEYIGEEKYRNVCIEHFPMMENKPEFLERPILTRRF
ncbi:MAG: hypothetical protein ISS95_01145 [Candidatus Aenigmarchaeota archaeon]|nr:hypothetical protein [Candidatus Aenigmarchaeota archaeon]